jgi:chitinase
MATRPYVLGYYADWNPALSPQKIDYRLFTHLTHSFAKVGKDGSFLFPELAKSRDLCARAHTAGTKVILAIGGASSAESLTQGTATPAGRKRVVDQLVAQVKVARYDGLDIDWEFPENPAQRDQMNELTKQLRERLPQAVLTMAVPALDWNGKWYERDALLPYLDFVNVMTYDFHGPWSHHAGHNAPLRYSNLEGHPECRTNTTEGGMAYWQKQKNWPKEKILLGIPLYGHGFRASRWGGETTGAFEHSDVSYKEIQTLRKAGWTREWDKEAQVPFLLNPQKTTIISYDDADSIRLKGEYARNQGVGGIFFWEISQDFDGKTNPLVRAARSGLGR